MKPLALGLLSALLIHAVASYPTAQERRKQFHEIDPFCIKMTGVTQDIRLKLLHDEFTGEPVMKTYVHCLLLEMDVIDEHGQLDYGYLKYLAREAAGSEEEANKVFEKCAVKMESAEETAFEVDKCFHLNLKNFGE